MRQGPGNEGRVGQSEGELEGYGMGQRSPWWIPRSGTSEVGLVLLELHHKVVNVDKLSPGRESSELGLRQHPVEAMIELDQLGQCSLVRESQGGVRLWGSAKEDD